MIDTVAELFTDLDDRGITYCHWKSNEKLQAALNANTDLDILCHHGDQRTFHEVLKDHRFIRQKDVIFTGYPGIENYVGHDPETGRCIHVHLHTELTFGTPFLKEFVTPWGPYVLERRIIDPESGVSITDPTTELFLLIVRYALKIRRYNPIARRSYFEEFLEEYDWLAERADESEVETIARDLLNPRAADRIRDVFDGDPTIRDLIRVGKPIRSELDPYSTYPSWTTTPIALARKGFRGIGKLNREFLNRPYPSRRKLPNRGIEIAIIGIDGSGKSTHLSSLHDWLSWKMDVHSVYFGSGDGPSSLLRYPLKKLNELRTKFNDGSATGSGDESTDLHIAPKQSDGDDQKEKTNTDTSVGLAKAVWAILLAREKRKKRRRATRARNRGMIVLMDRYPQNQFEDINDGPLLQGWLNGNSKLLEKIATWERDIYADLEENSPDLVIKLETDPEVAKERKPETPMSNLQRKAEVIDSLEYENSRVVTVNTHRDIDDVLNEIKKEVWAEI
ncbi:hypothetical protein AArcSl_2960 [Halalkaliarchaeum desulfuricum]|uniref:Thymidylate kinase n=1 Tax=Halalkaliarchaeum desulfuricum TaxID=2055893 RepID=A0A343TN99_9EURY|nr:hypothetical protein [Halalkaliarchaeum desulfuricum]AUX10571.1 hypothetical protein AArcSl_2960 [Halalkaliarchaeum desulfuricum]